MGDAAAADSLLNAEAGGRILSHGMDDYVSACYNGDRPPCRRACPFDLDINAFCAKIQKGNFSGAYSLYRDKTVFPAIASEICDMPCGGACVRNALGGAVDLRRLERAAVTFARSTAPVKYNIPRKSEKIAVIGAGLCGLSCTLKLSSRGYAVTLFERSGRTGGRLWELYAEDIFLPEIKNQTSHLDFNLRLNTEINSLDALTAEYDAVIIATGGGGADFGLLGGLNHNSLGTERGGVFMGGSILGVTPIWSIENGVRAAQSAENYLKSKRMHVMQGIDVERASRFRIRTGNIAPSEKIIPKNAEYTKEEAAAEAARCLKCDCAECMNACDFMRYYKKLPKKIVSDVRVTLNSVDTLSPRVATRMLSSCNVCGLCGEVCAEHIDMGEFLLGARRIMRREGTLPPVFHDYWLRDMAHANSGGAYLSLNAPGRFFGEYVFFPGCQLGASDPEYVLKSYEYILGKNPKTGIILGCCGVPADWAGDEKLTSGVTEHIRREWEGMGKPVFILACATCAKTFAKLLPEIKTTTLYEFIAEHAPPNKSVTASCALPDESANASETVGGDERENSSEANGRDDRVSVFDPCSGRNLPSAREAVRRLLDMSGYMVEELPKNGAAAECCGFGGHIYVPNPALAEKIAENRVSYSGNPYITYCANCRDIFALKGKPVKHILDAVFQINGWDRKPPSLSKRRENRETLKARVLEKFFTETSESQALKDVNGIKLLISPELTEKLNKMLILEDNIRLTIKLREESGSKLYSPDDDCFIGHSKQGYVTYWVHYRPEGDAFRVLNAYSHRLTIEGDADSLNEGGLNTTDLNADSLSKNGGAENGVTR